MRKHINKQWYSNKNVRPKLLHVVMERDPRGGYRIVRGDVAVQINQHQTEYQRLDARDLAQDIRNKGGAFAL